MVAPKVVAEKKEIMIVSVKYFQIFDFWHIKDVHSEVTKVNWIVILRNFKALRR